MKVVVLDYNTGKVHIHNVNSQKEVMNYVNKHQTDNWMLSQDNEFEVIYHEE